MTYRDRTLRIVNSRRHQAAPEIQLQQIDQERLLEVAHEITKGSAQPATVLVGTMTHASLRNLARNPSIVASGVLKDLRAGSVVCELELSNVPVHMNPDCPDDGEIYSAPKKDDDGKLVWKPILEKVEE